MSLVLLPKSQNHPISVPEARSLMSYMPVAMYHEGITRAYSSCMHKLKQNSKARLRQERTNGPAGTSPSCWRISWDTHSFFQFSCLPPCHSARLCQVCAANYVQRTCMWVVVKIMVPSWIPTIMRHLIFRVPKKSHNFDNHPCVRAS